LVLLLLLLLLSLHLPLQLLTLQQLLLLLPLQQHLTLPLSLHQSLTLNSCLHETPPACVETSAPLHMTSMLLLPGPQVMPVLVLVLAVQKQNETGVLVEAAVRPSACACVLL
jgi:hypothetical protein